MLDIFTIGHVLLNCFQSFAKAKNYRIIALIYHSDNRIELSRQQCAVMDFCLDPASIFSKLRYSDSDLNKISA
jgi:hypothetical protein